MYIYRYVYGRSSKNIFDKILVRVSRNEQTLESNITLIGAYHNLAKVEPRKYDVISPFCRFFDSKRNKLWIPENLVNTNTGETELTWMKINPITGIIEKNFTSITLETEFTAGCIYNEEIDLLISIHPLSENTTTHYFAIQVAFANPETLIISNRTSMMTPTDQIYCLIEDNVAYDSVNRILYQLMFKKENVNDNCNDENTSWDGYIIGMSTDNGSVVSSAKSCMFADCPLSIQYWDGN